MRPGAFAFSRIHDCRATDATLRTSVNDAESPCNSNKKGPGTGSRLIRDLLKLSLPALNRLKMAAGGTCDPTGARSNYNRIEGPTRN